MTVRALAGLAVFNLFVLGLGAAVLWALRGWRWWTELIRLAGVAYLLGLSAFMLVSTYALVTGIPVRPATWLTLGAVVVGAGLVVGRARGFPAPGLRPPDWRFPRISLFAAVFVAGIAVFFEALFRAERLGAVARVWDSWANWLPKGKSLYLSGTLDLEFLKLVPQLPSYPPGPATIQAGAFHAMGSADTATLHVQSWFIALGFAAAIIGLLAGRVHPAILFPAFLAFLVAPSLVEWSTTIYADLPMGYLIAAAALLLILWIEERERWQLAVATVLLAGAMLTKREGMLFAVCVVLAALVASFAKDRRLSRPLVVAGLAAFVLVLPWRIWFTAQGLPATASDTGYDGAVSDLDRLWPAVEMSFRTLFHEPFWHIAPLIGVAAILLAVLARAWIVSLYAGTLLVAGLAAVAWVLWVNHGLALIHEDWALRRLAGTTFLTIAVLTPLLLERAWGLSEGARLSAPGRRVVGLLFRPALAPWLVVLVGLLSHPGSILVGYSGSGLPDDWPTFPGTAGCALTPESSTNVRVVVGYADSYPEARELTERARAAGLREVEAGQDGCGRVRVYVDDVPSMMAAESLVAATGASNLDVTVEHDPDD